ncbi:tail fiber protein [Bacillus phage Shbh1]|uniref:Putative structural protein n=1 Tax=Bacillus phage Shbh1 TaxID=1796992 RepID=A0A142F1D8_9CAUD|nr:tail fiber protein [Bacillus phage Shbh1]AMQ66595.1 putative structural protein [Bacillus phage Shbh1]
MLHGENYRTPYGPNNPERIPLDKVNDYKLEDYGLTVENVKANHFGVEITDPRTGQHLPDAFYRAKIEDAVAKVEKQLDIVILPRIVREYHDYNRMDYNSHTYLHTFQKPIVQVESIALQYSGHSVFRYPSRWWRVYHLYGHLQMLPALMLSGEQGNLSLAQSYSGFPMIAGVPPSMSNTSMPQLFQVDYVAGMLPPSRRGVSQPWEMHPDLWDLIVKHALKEVFQQWGRLIIGPGIAGMTMQIDGVSQSIDTTQSAMYGGASAEIIQLDNDIKELTNGLKSYYGQNLGIV